MVDVIIHIRPAAHSTTMDKDVIKVSLCITSVWPKQTRHKMTERIWGVVALWRCDYTCVSNWQDQATYVSLFGS